MKSKSLWYTTAKRVEVREIEIPSPGPGEALVRVDACGVCTWDLFIFSGGFSHTKPFPFYFGHEGIGHVAAVGPGVTRIRVGDRVALLSTADIGSIGGGHMAEYALQKQDVLVPIPEDRIPAEHWMIEPAACCVNAIDLAHIRAGARVALVGSGFMGSILLQLLAMSPVSKLTAFDLRPESIAYARSLNGGAAVEVVDLKSEDPLSGDRAGTYDLVFEAAAAEPAFRLANALVRTGGTIGIFSWHHHEITFDFGDWHVRGITVLNTSPAANPHFQDCFYQARELIAAGRIDLAPLVTHVDAAEGAQSLFEKGLGKTDGYVKGVIRWS
ncbi:MAG TPA: alcohol dehydrogenase catalytic domain-containing protein [Spirochaetia bacterium]|nr:alcohol dehydrogenase catalytic domain-containing protein [Spirochaetia bacterium]